MINIAIDGPSGAGKSTIARKAAAELGYVYVDTGAMYRAIGVHAVRSGADPHDAAQVVPLLDSVKLDIRYVDGEQRVFLGGEDVSDAIRTPEASMAASAVSAIKEVRAFLLDLQRDMAKTHDVIMDGRDIGTVILPNADVKIFLTATPEDRAQRRMLQLREKGENQPYEEVLADIIKRDYDDSHRAESPLRQAPDAIYLDTTGNTFEQSVEAVMKLCRK